MLQRTSGVDGLTVSVSVRGFILWDDGEKFDEEDSDASKESPDRDVPVVIVISSIEFFLSFRSFAVRYIRVHSGVLANAARQGRTRTRLAVLSIWEGPGR